MITVKQAKLADNPKNAAALAHIQAALTGDTSTGLVYLPPKKQKEKHHYDSSANSRHSSAAGHGNGHRTENWARGQA